MSIADLIALLETEYGIPAGQQALLHRERPIQDTTGTIDGHGIESNDILLLVDKSVTRASDSRSPVQGGVTSNSLQDTEMVRLQVLGDPSLMSELRQTQPNLADSVQDPQVFARELRRFEAQRSQAERKAEAEMQKLHENPFDEESQRKIEEIIRQEAVMDNLRSALEYNPECRFF